MYGSNADTVRRMIDRNNNIKPEYEGDKSVDEKDKELIIKQKMDNDEEEREEKEKASEFIEESKIFFVTESIARIFKKASNALLLENSDAYRRNLVREFVVEEGADKLLSRFRTSSELLSETALIVSKYINEAKKIAANDNSTFKLAPPIVDKFYEDLDTTDTTEVSDTIRNRVLSAIDDFTTQNLEEKMKIKDALADAKKLTKKYSEEDDTVKESYNDIARRQISEIENSVNTNVYGYLVKDFAKNVITSTNESFKEKFMENDAKLNMRNISETCKTIYTFLETINTTKIKNIDEEYIRKNIIKK